MIDFNEDQIKILRKAFDSLDEDGSQAIGVDELEDPLIALGLVDNRVQVEKLVSELDEDQNIEFEEFLKLVKGGNKSKEKIQKSAVHDEGGVQTDLIYDFFNKLTNGELNDGEEEIPFSLHVGKVRRQALLGAIQQIGQDKKGSL